MEVANLLSNSTALQQNFVLFEKFSTVLPELTRLFADLKKMSMVVTDPESLASLAPWNSW